MEFIYTSKNSPFLEKEIYFNPGRTKLKGLEKSQTRFGIIPVYYTGWLDLVDDDDLLIPMSVCSQRDS